MYSPLDTVQVRYPGTDNKQQQLLLLHTTVNNRYIRYITVLLQATSNYHDTFLNRMNESINQFIHSSIHRSIHRSIHSSIHRSIHSSVFNLSKKTMKFQRFLLSALSLLTSVTALSSNLSVDRPSKLSTSQTLKKRRRSSKTHHNEEKKKCQICPDPELDLDLDRREATFAMIGQLWATSAGAGAASLFSSPEEAHAVLVAENNSDSNA